MFSLASRFNPARFWEYRQKIARLKNALKKNDIILMQDFYEHAVRPALEADGVFANIFGQEAKDLPENLEALATGEGLWPWGKAKRYDVPYAALPAHIQEELDAEIADEVASIIGNLEVVHRMLGSLQGMSMGDIHRGLTEKIKETKSLPAYEARSYLDAMNVNRGFPFGLTGGETRYELRSYILTGGDSAVAFWQNVVNLKDYYKDARLVIS